MPRLSEGYDNELMGCKYELNFFLKFLTFALSIWFDSRG